MHDAVTVTMDAPIEEVWDLVSDVTRIGEFSPETFEAEWTGGASGPAAGARFRGHVKRNQKGPVYWTECVVDTCEPPGTVAGDRAEFSFGVVTNGRTLNTWGYVLEAEGDATRVTESFQLTDTRAMRLYWFLLGWARGKTNRRGMQQTLERMRAVVES